MLDIVARGYALVLQEARGTGLSGGSYTGYSYERPDGHDTISWAARQPWSNGRIGIYGSSYMGLTSSQALIGAPPELQAAVVYMTSPEFRDGWFYSGDAFEIGWQLRWWLNRAMSMDARSKSGRDSELAKTFDLFTKDPLAFYSYSLDVSKIVARLGPAAAPLKSLLQAGPNGPIWDDLSVIRHVELVHTPVLSVAGWHDAFVRSLIVLYKALRTSSAPEVREHHRLIIGPWDHQSYLSSQTVSSAGLVNYGPSASGGRTGLRSTLLTWFDRWLKDAEAEPVELPIRYFHMGPNVWRTTTRWPPNVVEQRWHLDPAAHGDLPRNGRLTVIAPSDARVDRYVYDPMEPTPTVGGRTLLYFIPAGPQDQERVSARSDVLVYDSDALIDDLPIVGPIFLDLVVSSTAPTADFHAILCEGSQDGRVLNMADGVFRIPLSVGPIAQRRITINLGDTAYTFARGNKVRLLLSSSSFPRFDRNRNVGPQAGLDDYEIAVEEIHCGPHFSALRLPVEVPISQPAASAPRDRENVG
jgi:hypothetical protein